MSVVDLTRRIDASEWMDSADLSAAELRPALRFISMANRYLGGHRVLFRYLRRWSRDWPAGREIAFLDVGTGDADIPVAVARWGRANGFRLRIKAIDSTPAIAEIARQNARHCPEIEVAEADFFSFAGNGSSGGGKAPDRAFDYVICSLFLHHISDDRLVQALQLCDRLARRGIIISDLARSFPSYCGVKLLTWLSGNRIAQNDGPISVRRAFTPDEMSGLARQAGLPYLRAQRHPFFRLSLAGRKADPHA